MTASPTVASGPGWELRCGRWEDVLDDVEGVDALIVDPPYSDRTEKGQRSAGTKSRPQFRQTIHYGHITGDDIDRMVGRWAPITQRWWVAFGDHITVPAFLGGLGAAGWYTFAPVAWTKSDAPPRFLADGPSPSIEWAAVARPRRRLDRTEKRHRPGHYHGRRQAASHNSRAKHCLVGTKPLWLMRAVVRGYSEPGDMICDPCAGSGTTLLAAVIEGRRAIGAEMDPETFALAARRLRRGYTPAMDFGEVQDDR